MGFVFDKLHFAMFVPADKMDCVPRFECIFIASGLIFEQYAFYYLVAFEMVVQLGDTILRMV